MNDKQNPTTNPQESHPMCQRGRCLNQGKIWAQAICRCTIEAQTFEQPVTLYGITFMTIINGLAFPERQITVDLCVACYHILKHDHTLTMTSILGIDPDRQVY